MPKKKSPAPEQCADGLMFGSPRTIPPAIEHSRLIELIAMLAARWPRCFAIYQRRRRPLKIGIDRDLAAALGDSVTPVELEVVLSRYVRSEGYLFKCVADAARIDLDGAAAGSVTAEQAVHAAAWVTARIRRRAAAKAEAKARASPDRSSPAGVKRATLADLKAAAQAKKDSITTVSDRVEVG
jgi:ProP effector